MIRKIATLIIKLRILILAGILVLTGFWVYKLKDLNLEQDLSDIIPPNHPYTQVDKKFFEIDEQTDKNVDQNAREQGDENAFYKISIGVLFFSGSLFTVNAGIQGIPLFAGRIVGAAGQFHAFRRGIVFHV